MSGLMDVFDDKPEPEKAPASAPTAAPSRPTPSYYGPDLPEAVSSAVSQALKAADEARATKAALDAQKEEIKATLDRKLAPLNKSYKDAQERLKEAEGVLLKAMQAEKISKIPLEDRPEIKIKVTPGRKLSITRKWLADPEGIVVKTYGPSAPGVIWDAVPRSEERTEVVIPPPYEDEPEG